MALFQEKIVCADFHLFAFKNQTVDSRPWERPCSDRHHNTTHIECLQTRLKTKLNIAWEYAKKLTYNFLVTMHLVYL